MRKYLKFLFRVVVFFPFGILLAYLLSLFPVYEFSWFYALFFTVCGALVRPKSVYAWEVILDYYEKNVPGISRLTSKIGYFKDKSEAQSEGIAIFTSVTDDGLVLFRGHILAPLREAAVIPWEKVESLELIDSTPISDNGLRDQVSDMVAKLRIENVTTVLEIPWSKEIEMYSNLFKDGVIKSTTNKKRNELDTAEGAVPIR